jgi:predicted nucleic acid-binding protein
MLTLVAEVIYFDTNPLVCWATGRSGSTDPRDVRSATRLEAAVSSDDMLYLSPITLVEFNTTLYKLVRRKDGPSAAFGLQHAIEAEARLMKWIAGGRIVVPQLGQRAFEVGMSYVAAATRQHGRKVHAWDAIHLFEACRLARTLERRVVIATSDSDFDALLEIYPEFRGYVEIQDYAN